MISVIGCHSSVPEGMGAFAITEPSDHEITSGAKVLYPYTGSI